ncbi:hypothetical protein CR152_06550 [Massilia violaceinigra]|uniref:Uncharacterized protein n=1 Tax=Massilia violaceinigra TaxID=2045208 RepID=A0A2D2DGX2_9BURK|nr:hypothetical protein CR152_06550 [Massilia violaceinigra]
MAPFNLGLEKRKRGATMHRCRNALGRSSVDGFPHFLLEAWLEPRHRQFSDVLGLNVLNDRAVSPRNH